jgi:hypothetical protein
MGTGIYRTLHNSDSGQIGSFFQNLTWHFSAGAFINVSLMQISHFRLASHSELSRNNRLATRIPSVLVLRRLYHRITRVQPLRVPVNQMWVRVQREDL